LGKKITAVLAGSGLVSAGKTAKDPIFTSYILAYLKIIVNRFFPFSPWFYHFFAGPKSFTKIFRFLIDFQPLIVYYIVAKYGMLREDDT
jgi:hypothetical protein